MNLNDLKRELLRNPKFKKEYYNPDIASQIAEMIIDLRIKLGLTQKELAKKVGTHQSSIARLENGSFSPNISFLVKIANAVKTELIPPKFSILENSTETFDINLNLSELLSTAEAYNYNYKTLSNH